MSTCSFVLKADKLPKIINKVEFFLFKAAERKGINFLEMANPSESLFTELINDAKTIIKEHIDEYKDNAKYFQTVDVDQEAADSYVNFAANLETILVGWNQVVANFAYFNQVAKVKTKFKLDENGLVDMTDVADDMEKMTKSFVFDQAANEIDPLDDVDKSVELFIRSLQSVDQDGFQNDEYGYTVSVDYPNLIKQMFSDLENSTSLSEIINKLEKNKSKVLVYQTIIDKLKASQDANTKQDFQFAVNFASTFSKAYLPINLVSVEDSLDGKRTIKVFDAVSGKRGKYLTQVESEFMLFGLPVVKDGKVINLATYKNNTWQLTQDNIKDIRDYLNNAPESVKLERNLSFLKGLGFKISEKTESIIKKDFLKQEGKKTSQFTYMVDHILNHITNGVVTNPIKTITRDLYKDGDITSKSQKSNLDRLIDLELANNNMYAVERSVVNPNGDRVHALQLHNNFTVVNHYLSDPNQYPTLQSILEKEPSMFWLDPRKNPSIANSVILNSLFYYNPDSENFGKRRRVAPDGKWSDTKGEYVTVILNNTGGVQYTSENDFAKDGSSTTDLNELDKLLQDINSFYEKNYSSILRLGDKSTDLGIALNYYIDPSSEEGPIRNQFKNKRYPLASIQEGGYENVFENNLFLDSVYNAFKDVVMTRFLANKGLLSNFKMFSKNGKSTFSYFDKIITNKKKFREALENKLNDPTLTIDDVRNLLDNNDKFKQAFNREAIAYFKEYSERFSKKFKGALDKNVSTYNLVRKNKYQFQGHVNFYLANAFILDVEQMKVFFGDSLFFKDFTKRASKDSATGNFTFMDESYIKHFNDFENKAGYGANTNLTGRLLIDRIYEQRLNELESAQIYDEEVYNSEKQKIKDERDQALLKQKIGKSFRSGVIKDIEFESTNKNKILDSIKSLIRDGEISKDLARLFDFENRKNKPLSNVIDTKYNGKEGDGQGKCTFDFYRLMSILTKQWSKEQEEAYEKIVMYSHYDSLAESARTDSDRSDYIRKRDAVGYDPTEQVFFPPKKFQYSGPQNNSTIIDNEEYSMNVPVFDKFSLQPLIPTVIKGTVDEQLAKKMEYNGIGYVKFESGSKVETPKDQDDLYYEYDSNSPDKRVVKLFDYKDTFKSEQELFFNHFKEQVTIDAEIHESVIFGSQIRKLIMMNLEKPEFKGLYREYVKYIDDLVQFEKSNLYNKMGIRKQADGKLKIDDLSSLVEFFFKEIAKKNQDSNVLKALKFDSQTNNFEIPLDAAVQAQVIEGIVISAINNNIVRYKTNGSMLTQMAISGSERIKLSKDSSKTALETYGNSELNYYALVGEKGNYSVSKMDVKIALTGQWLRLLELTHYDGFKIESLDRLNEALRNTEWKAKHEKALTMVAYRIPTQGRNFTDVMLVKEFLPASVGDAIVMPSEVVIKSGSDFDIDKMFVFYPNLDRNGKYVDYEYTNDYIGQDLEKKKDEVVFNLKHTKNYRDMTLPRMQEEYDVLKSKLKRQVKFDTSSRAKLNDLVRQVKVGLMLLEAEDKAIRREFETLATINEKSDSRLHQLIESSVIFDLGEYESYKKTTGTNIFNAKMWIDKKREGLTTLLTAVENLRNSALTVAQNEEAFQREMMQDFKSEIETELKIAREKLYKYTNIKGNIQNKLYDVMSKVILHPANFPELVTPSENYHIMPVVESILVKLGVSKPGSERQKTDYKHTDILDRGKNIDKFLSLLKGKADLGIAAVANTFNVLFQVSKATANPKYFQDNEIKMFFDSPYLEKHADGTIKHINYSEIFDEDGIPKSEFFSEFINAFVDVAKDDYVFGVNVVTELSPTIFYMKFAGISTDKILAFVNQPAIREYIKNLSTYQNLFLKNQIKDDNPKFKTGIRTKALKETLLKLGYEGKTNRLGVQKLVDFNKVRSAFNKDAINNSIKEKDIDIRTLTKEEKQVQIAMLLEMLNLKEQSNALREAQSTLNFDTNPYSSTFDINQREYLFNSLSKGDGILSTKTMDYIKNNSIISSLNVGKDISEVLENLFPIRNKKAFNDYLLAKANSLLNNRDNKSINNTEDVERFARTAKNDFANYVIQNYFDKSAKGVAFFKEQYGTDLSLNEYLKELVETDKLVSNFQKIKSNTNLYNLVKQSLPFIENLVIERGDNNKGLISYKFVQNGSNVVEKESVIAQFQDAISVETKEVADFFKDLALYSIFQSGLNTSDISYTGVTPVSLTNKLYGFAFEEYNNETKDMSDDVIMKDVYVKFNSKFIKNNPQFDSKKVGTFTKDVAKRGKWYSEDVKLEISSKLADVDSQEGSKVEQEFQAEIPQNKVAGVDSFGSTVKASAKVVEKLGEHAHSIDMVINGLRTRTTRSSKEMEKYDIKVGDVIKNKGTSADGSVKEVYARVTAIHPKDSPGWKGTWEKEGWNAESVTAIDKFLPGAAAIEFELIQPIQAVSGFQGYKGGFENTGKGTPQGDGKDKAMRAVATGSIVEFKTDKVKSSSLTTLETVGKDNSYSYEKDRYVGQSYNGVKDFKNNYGSVVMLARNGKLAGIELNVDTKVEIKTAHNQGSEFVVGDMPGVDSQFIDYLQEIGAKFTIYHTGSTPRIQITSQPTQAAPVVSFDELTEFTPERKQEIITNFATKHGMSKQEAKSYISNAIQNNKEKIIDILKTCY